MNISKSIVLSAILLGNMSINASEDLDLISVESSTIGINEDKKTEVSSSSIINEEKIETVGINNINDVLKTIPGTTISTRTGEMAQIHFRGVGQQQFMGENSGVAIIVDGVPVMQQAGGIRLNLKDIETIKVIKGSASYLYGDTALAGALIITTSKPKDKNSIDLEATLGSHNYKDYLLSLYKSNDSLAVLLNGSHRSTDGYWVDSELWTKSITGKLMYFLNDTSDVSFTADITNKYDQAGSRSVTAGVSEAQSNPKGDGDSYSKDNYIDLDKFTLSYNKSFENDTNLLISTYFYKDFYKKTSNPQDSDSNSATPDVYTHYLEQNLSQSGIKAEYTINDDKFASLLGLEFGKREYENKDDTIENYTAYDRRKKANVNYYDGESTLSSDEETIVGLYTEFKYNFTPKLTTTFNIRYDYQDKELNTKERDFDGTVWSNKNSSKEKTFRNFSYRLGSTYKLNDNNSIFASYSTAFETPDVEDIESNENIKEQTSRNYELGLRGNKDIFTYETSVYQLDNRNIIGPEGGTYSFGDTTDNAGDTRSRGLELSLKSDAQKTVSFDFAYTYLHTSYTRYNTFKHTYQDRSTHNFDIVGNTIPRTSKHTVDLFLNYRATKKLTLISEIYAKSSYYADETNIVKMPGYGILNLQARYKTKMKKDNLEFFVKANNVFDKQYYRAAYLHRDKRGDVGVDSEDVSIVVDPGREYYAGLKYSF